MIANPLGKHPAHSRPPIAHAFILFYEALGKHSAHSIYLCVDFSPWHDAQHIIGLGAIGDFAPILLSPVGGLAPSRCSVAGASVVVLVMVPG